MSDAFERAVDRERVRDYKNHKLGFQVHLFVFIATQALLIVTWYLTTGKDGNAFPWFIFPLLGWGIGLGAHLIVYLSVKRDRQERSIAYGDS